MASPNYNTPVFRRHHGGFGGHRRRWWHVVLGKGSQRGGNTPPYIGGGQPLVEEDGELLGKGTPVYLEAPTSPAAATPSTTPSDTMIQGPVTNAAAPSTTTATPQPAPAPIVVPRS